MGDKKRNIKQRKKTIKKPKFLPEFLKSFALFLVLSLAASYIILTVYMNETVDVLLSRSDSIRHDISKALVDYLKADDSEKDEYFNILEYYLTQYAVVTREYCAVYVGDEKLIETGSGYLIAANISDDKEHPYYVFLEDDLYLTPLSLCENGKYAPFKNADRDYSLNYQRDMDHIAMTLGLIARPYCVYFENIYVDYDTHRFVPGTASITPWGNMNVIDTVDCTPPNSLSYTEIEFNKGYTVCGLSGNKTEEDVTEWFYENKDASFEFGIPVLSEDNWGYPWSIRTSSAQYYNMSVFQLLPWTCAFVIGAAMFFALIAALIVAVIRYNSKKTIWEIFEYRTKTTAAMAHDLKTPLAAMAAYAENLEYDVNTEKRAYYSSRIRENIDYMSKTVEGILDFSKSETGSVKAEIAEIDVHDLIQKEVEAADELFARLEINVEIKGEGKVKSDRELLEQATRNLIGNVAKYARARTRVDIEIGKEGFTITNLTDQKIKDASKLKEPFVKGEESRGSENGSGLGLSIADNCLAAAGHKLDIKVEGDKFIAGVRW